MTPAIAYIKENDVLKTHANEVGTSLQRLLCSINKKMLLLHICMAGGRLTTVNWK